MLHTCSIKVHTQQLSQKRIELKHSTVHGMPSPNWPSYETIVTEYKFTKVKLGFSWNKIMYEQEVSTWVHTSQVPISAPQSATDLSMVNWRALLETWSGPRSAVAMIFRRGVTMSTWMVRGWMMCWRVLVLQGRGCGGRGVGEGVGTDDEFTRTGIIKS